MLLPLFHMLSFTHKHGHEQINYSVLHNNEVSILHCKQKTKKKKKKIITAHTTLSIALRPW